MALGPSPRRAVKLALVAALAGAVAAACTRRLARFEVLESSMEPTLGRGDYLIALAGASVRRGDIVVYPDPAMPVRYLVKRVVGLPGENVAIAGGRVMIDGAVLTEAWADGPTLPDGDWAISPESIFTLGDNRRLSSGDGRASGPIPLTEVHKVVWRYWPPRAFGGL